ncbi:hypothetical protein [Bifidobacterium vespertilionis]|uniref:hypothetical protein n=1 Tax=Bifidobacterium vespertilionis TaxID=2562524 RepID=UPI001BDC06FA|nr:hypothetical protein [Bifidobacterium vespertilionis]MBT1179635.1 hypothetical protein [Bifidobacterium vespertilionis]
MAQEEQTLKRPTAPTGRNLNQDEYWKSLERSFNKDFIEQAREKYAQRQRLQVG